MGNVGGNRNYGYGKQLAWAGKNALADRYGHGHFATRAAHATWKVTLWVKNALDEEYNRGGVASGFANFAWAGDPRQAGVSFSYDF